MGLAVASVLLDGSFIHLWRLHRDKSRLETRIQESKQRLRQLEFRIQEAQEPQFIERQARDQFDLVKEGDLIFVFSDDPGDNYQQAEGKFFTQPKMAVSNK